MKAIEFEGQDLVMGAPPGTPEGKCNGLPMKVGPSDIWMGAREYISYWKPDAAELKALNDGAHVALIIHGTTHPPVHLAVHYHVKEKDIVEVQTKEV